MTSLFTSVLRPLVFIYGFTIFFFRFSLICFVFGYEQIEQIKDSGGILLKGILEKCDIKRTDEGVFC